MSFEAGKQWEGKKWYCYGTSMTYNGYYGGLAGTAPDGSENRPERTGYYSDYLAEYAGLEQHNFGKPGSGIVPALHGEDSVKTRIMNLADGKLEADLITLETIANDTTAPLGEVTDWSDETFCGNLNQVLSFLLENTKAVVAVLIATRSRYEPLNPKAGFFPTEDEAMKRLKWEEAVEQICRIHGVPCWNGAAEAGLGYFRMGSTQEYVQDQIHLTEKGGRMLARYYWGRLQALYPID